MTNILHITASIQADQSVSRALSTKLVSTLTAKSGANITTRDLSTNDLPFIDAERFAANLAPIAERTAEQRNLAAISDQLIDELQAADTIVFGVPIYNFSVPATLKAWADLVARAGTTFRYTPDGPQGLLEGKRAFIALASGGTPAGSPMDFMTPWLTFFLGFLGVHDVTIIAADGVMGANGEEKIAQAHSQIEQLAA